MKEYDIFIPLYYNDGAPVESAKFQDLQTRLLEQFDGLTYFPQPPRRARPAGKNRRVRGKFHRAISEAGSLTTVILLFPKIQDFLSRRFGDPRSNPLTPLTAQSSDL